MRRVTFPNAPSNFMKTMRELPKSRLNPLYPLCLDLDSIGVTIRLAQQRRLGLLQQGAVAVGVAVCTIDRLRSWRNICEASSLLSVNALAVLCVASIAAVYVGFQTGALARVGLADALVLSERVAELLLRGVVDELAAAQRVRYGEAQQTVPGLQDGLSALVNYIIVELRVVDCETGSRKEAQEATVLLGGQESPLLRQSSCVSHINRDGVTVTKWCLRNQLVERRPPVVEKVSDHGQLVM